MKRAVISSALAAAIVFSSCYVCSASSLFNKAQGGTAAKAYSVTDNVSPKLSSYTVKAIQHPIVTDMSSQHKSTEITALSKQFGTKDVRGLYFLDNSTVVFSAANGTQNDDDYNMCYDLYKFSLKTGVVSLVCRDYMINEGTISVKDANNFTIYDGSTYLKIENGKKTVMHNFIKEANQKFGLLLADGYYNEQAKKLLFLRTDNKGSFDGAYISDIDFSRQTKLPFNNVYRVQWADKDHVLVAYKDGDKSILANYSLNDRKSVLTELPVKNYFIDPQVCDNGMITFTYLQTDGLIVRPFGFLNLKTGKISRISFDSFTEAGSVRNDRVTAFIGSSIDNYGKSRLFVYNLNDNSETIIGTVPEYPDDAAVFPDGSSVIFQTHRFVNDKPIIRFFISKKK